MMAGIGSVIGGFIEFSDHIAGVSLSHLNSIQKGAVIFSIFAAMLFGVLWVGIKCLSQLTNEEMPYSQDSIFLPF
jgi:hypothetical protein